MIKLKHQEGGDTMKKVNINIQVSDVLKQAIISEVDAINAVSFKSTDTSKFIREILEQHMEKLNKSKKQG